MVNRWRRHPDQPGGGRRLGWPLGCLLWLVLLVIVLVMLSVLFGGFRLGTQAESPGSRPTVVGAAATTRCGAESAVSRSTS
jgi:hypothetical protein